MAEREKPRVAITGAAGVIGTVLAEGLSDYELKLIDLPTIDVRNFEQLTEALQGQDIVIHLAWNTEIDNWRSGTIDPDDAMMALNVYKAASSGDRRKRVVIASSVHADSYLTWEESSLMSTEKTPEPDSPYGANKVFIEALGRHFASKGLEVVCVRFGGVKPDDTQYDEKKGMEVYLSHRDCVNLIRRIIESQSIPNNFVLVYAVSDNEGRVHDTGNPFGWKPLDESR